MPDFFAHSDTNLQTEDRHPHTMPLSSVPMSYQLSVEFHVLRTEHVTGWKWKQAGTKTIGKKGWRGLTGTWWDWRWCGVGGFLTRTCSRGWRCSQRGNSAAFSHRRRRPAPNLSECLSSSGKTHEIHVRLPLLGHHW